VLPLVIAKGAGAELRWSLGITVFAGMIGVTLFGIFLTPVFYEKLTGLSDRWHGHHPEPEAAKP
jgi:multidrug efflux pump subunit AcrB